MTPRTSVFRVVMGLATALALTLATPAPALAVTVSLNTSRTTAPPSTAVTFSGTATGAPAGIPVTLQRRLGSGSWSTIKTGGSISASDTYSFTTYVAVGTYSYRAKVGTSAYSPDKSVSGTYGRNVSVPAAGEPFTFLARLPQLQPRLVKAQFSTNGGSTWTTRGQATSNSAGGVAIRTYLVSTSYVRLIAPATSTLPTWVGPRGIVTIGIDPVIKRILDDTNAFRDANGHLPPLALHPSLNKVAGNWAYTMYANSNPSNCMASFKHNPSYSSQYPPGWTAAAENIAAGQAYDKVVTGAQPGVQPKTVDYGWIDSPVHRANILGNYTHIGVGYYDAGAGGKCYKRYWVQNFAKY